MTTAPNRKPQKPAKGPLGKLLALAAVLGVGAAVVLLVLPRFGITVIDLGTEKAADDAPADDPKQPKWDPEVVSLMRAHLKQWGQPPGVKDSSEAVAAAYLAALSFAPPEKESVHPDARFARRFPKPRAKDKDPLTQAAFTEQLREVLAELRKEKKVPEQWKLKELVEETDKATDFAAWFEGWAKTGLKAGSGKDGFVFPLDEPADERSAAFTARFVKPTNPSSDAKDAAEKLVDQLHGWKVRGVAHADAKNRPGFVARVYLHFASGQHFGAGDLDGKDWHGAFLRRLPKAPAGAKEDVSTEEGMRAAFKELLGALKGKPGPTLSDQLLNLRKALDYREWLDATRKDTANPDYKDYVLNDALLPAGVVRFAERFRPKPKE
jgi:hypothetical protein